MKITAIAPTRISLFGGGTDVDPFASEYGGKVLNMAINLRHYATLIPVKKGLQSYIEAMGESRFLDFKSRPKNDPKFDLIYEILDFYIEKLPSHFIFEDTFDGLQSAGLGSSASAAVSMIGAFNRWLGLKRTKNQIAERAWASEIELGWVSGKQDQYASTYGGVNFFEFDKQVWNEPINKGICDEFIEWCLLVYTGKTRHSAFLQNQLKERMKSSKETIDALRAIRTLTWEARDALKKADYEKVGIMLGQEWELKKKSNPAVTNERIDGFYNIALKKGALGGKILGAGGEGHMLFIVNPNKRKQVIDNLGLQEIDFSIDYNGLETRIL